MEIKCAKSAGFCFGVKRAVDTVYEQIAAAKGQAVYTYGPIIHNEEVIRDMREKGITVLQNIEELDAITQGIVIIRSHGVGKHVYDKLHEKGLHLVDATCPFVKKIHAIVEEQSAKEREIVIIGNKEHPEVIGTAEWAGEGAVVVGQTQEAERFKSSNKNLCIVAQTTFNYKKFEELVEIIRKKEYDIIVLNTICNATKSRQGEAKTIAKESDAMLVIGDKRSSNTQKLFEICKHACKATYYIQTLENLDLSQLRDVKRVGITAGASTPNTIIEEVQNNVRINF